jgi:hypothetical protein
MGGSDARVFGQGFVCEFKKKGCKYAAKAEYQVLEISVYYCCFEPDYGCLVRRMSLTANVSSKG